MDKLDPILYSYFREVMDRHADLGIKLISYPRARWVLSRFMVPSQLRMKILEEMKERRMLKHIDKFKLEITWRENSKTPLLLSEIVDGKYMK